MRTIVESGLHPAAAQGSIVATGQHPPQFPADLSSLVPKEILLRQTRAAAIRGCGNSWMNLATADAAGREADELLVLIAYCYLQGMYHSIDIVRRLDLDPILIETSLVEMGLVPEQVRRFRREHRRALTDCLTHALVAVWQQISPGSHPQPGAGSATDGLVPSRLYFGFLEPFYLHAQDRVDRAVVLDSMALDY